MPIAKNGSGRARQIKSSTSARISANTSAGARGIASTSRLGALRCNARRAARAVEPVAASYRGEVAQRYRYLDGAGEVGFISSITAPFCRDCTRARLSADGSLYTCLFADVGTGLKQPLRDGASDGELRDIITGIWQRREDRYSEQRAEQDPLKVRVEMYQVGG